MDLSKRSTESCIPVEEGKLFETLVLKKELSVNQEAADSTTNKNDLLLESTDCGSSEECLQAQACARTEHSSATSNVNNKSHIPSDGSTIECLSDSNMLQRGGEFKELCVDSNLRLISCVVQNELELVMLLKLTNHNQSRVAIDGISIKIEPPSNLIADASQAEFILEKLSFLETVSITIELVVLCSCKATQLRTTARNPQPHVSSVENLAN